MSQLFTIHFEFAQKIYPALVAIDDRKENIVFRVYIRDKRLHSILPQGKLYIDIIRGVVLPAQLEHPSAEALIACISDAVSAHINQEKEPVPVVKTVSAFKQKA